MRTTKTLVRLGRCPGCSESSLGAHAILLVLLWGGSNEPSHEKRTLVSCHLDPSNTHAQPLSRMRDVAVCLKLSRYNVLYLQTGKALARLHGCAGLPEPLLIAYAIRTFFTWAGSTISAEDGVMPTSMFDTNTYKSQELPFYFIL